MTSNLNKTENSNSNIINPIWLSVSEAAKLGGINTKTIRRAIQSKAIKYKVVKNRYFIELGSIIIFLQTTVKLHNKLNQYGLGQYVNNWQDN